VSGEAPAKPKVWIKTFGCQMNVYDSGRMLDALGTSSASGAWETTDDVEAADLVLLNTCSIREKAEDKVFSDLGRLKRLKAKGTLIGVGGCVASQEGEAIVDRAPYVDVVFGPQTLHRLPAMVARARETGRPQVDVAFPEIEKFDALPPARAEGPTAFVSIMEGCSKYCSYCVVPYTRGDEVSRPAPSVLDEIAGLAAQGVREVTLLGQNVNAWRVAGEDFADLLGRVAAVDGIERIRYTTSHPKEFGASLVEAYRRLPQLVDHLHLPVQHGSDRILAAMKRGTTAIEFKSTIRKLRAARPAISLSSDFIVGFPGETEDDFAKLLALVEEVGFDNNSFSFVFSPRPGTPAAALEDATPQPVKLERLQRLQALLDARTRAAVAALVGTRQRVLVEAPAKRGGGDVTGRTSCNRVVNLQGPEALIGRFVDVDVTASEGHTLRGRPAHDLPRNAAQPSAAAMATTAPA
jgi:tRNA-2-methylthio-N6-dimethylallyladenosine synthase